jgi:hypothetical protein
MRFMADENANSGGAGEPPRRRRVPPPTIDLEATDVSPPSEPTAAAPDPAQPDPPPAETASAPPGDSPPAEPRPAEPPPAAGPAEPRRRFVPSWPQTAAAALGAVLALIVAGGVWALLGPASDQQADLNARLSRIEGQLGALSRPVPTTPDTRSADDLTQRLGRIEATLNDRLATVDREIKPLSDRLGDLGRRDDEAVAAARLARERADAAAKSLAEVAQQLAQLNAARANAPGVERADLDALAARLASLEASTKQVGDQLGRLAGAGNASNTGRAVVAIALNSAVERGAPYARELAAIDPAVAGAGTLEALRPFADTGLPSGATLARELAAVMPEALKAADAAAPRGGGGFLERLQSNAERLVRIRPIAQQAGDDPAAILGRVDGKSTRGDIAGALAEAAKLPATVRAPLEPWIKRAEAREAALAAAAALASQSLDVIRPSQGASDK